MFLQLSVREMPDFTASKNIERLFTNQTREENNLPHDEQLRRSTTDIFI